MLSHLRQINFEFHSHCNRECRWCPNSVFLRSGQDNFFSDEVFSELLLDLKKSNFGTDMEKYTDPLSRKEATTLFSFLGYQEPFTAPVEFKKRVRNVYDNVPKTVQIIANTNGDFLTSSALDELMLSTLEIMDYDNKGLSYWRKKVSDLGVLVIDVNEKTEIITGVHRYVGCITVHCNWLRHWKLEDRGGFFQEDVVGWTWKSDRALRDKPCYEMDLNVTIDHQGNVMPCCHMRADNPEHQPFILGNLEEHCLSDICQSDSFLRLQTALRHQEWEKPCLHCQKERAENFL